MQQLLHAQIGKKKTVDMAAPGVLSGSHPPQYLPVEILRGVTGLHPPEIKKGNVLGLNSLASFVVTHLFQLCLMHHDPI